MLTELKLVVTCVYSQDVQVTRAHNPLPNHVATAILATSKNIIHSAGTKMTSVATPFFWGGESGAHSPKMQQAACFPITLMLEPKSWP